MTEWRKDPFSNQWVIIPDQRAGRPYDFQWSFHRRSDAVCPFCAGNEHLTPNSVLELSDERSPDHFPWHVRVVPNRFPALTEDTQAALPSSATPQFDTPLLERKFVPGCHEVLIESPEHCASLHNAPLSRIVLAWEACRQRLSYWRSTGRFRFGMMFKNYGPLGGASLEHPHAQLIAMNEVPDERLRVWESCLQYHRRTMKCQFCDWLDRERTESTRVIKLTPRFLAVCPFASRFPYQVWIVRREHGVSFESADASELSELGQLLRELQLAQRRALGDVAYNLILHVSPFDSSECKHYHWYVETFPRISITAGFEWGSGNFINVVAPENAAAALKNGMLAASDDSQDISD